MTFKLNFSVLLADKSTDMDESERQSLLDSVDYNRLSETALQTALDSKLVPAAFIAKAALNLCSSLRNDLEASNALIRLQKAEMERLVTGGRNTGGRELGRNTSYNGHGTSVDVPDSKYTYRRPYTSSPAVSSTYRTGTGSAVYDHRRHATGSNVVFYQSVPSLASHLELQRALDSLNEDCRFGSAGSELTDPTCGISATGRYGLTGSGSSYYGCDGSSSDPVRSSTYSRCAELSSSARSPYVTTATTTVSIRPSAYSKRH